MNQRFLQSLEEYLVDIFLDLKLFNNDVVSSSNLNVLFKLYLLKNTDDTLAGLYIMSSHS